VFKIFAVQHRFWISLLLAIVCVPLTASTAPQPTPAQTNKPAEIVLDIRPTFGPPAKWIVPLGFQRVSKSTIAPGEPSRWLLSDKQINVPEPETFVHTAQQIFTQTGAQNGSRYTIDFDPSYQTLILHWARVWRGNTTLERLQPDKIKVIQPEPGYDRSLFTSQKTAILSFDDIRPDDIVDVAFSLRGQSPLFNGAYSDAIPVQSSVPFEHISARLLWPPRRHLYIKNHGTIPNPVITRAGALLDYKWNFTRVPGVRSEGSLPTWYDPHPWIQLSEFQTWGQVNDMVLRLFTATNALSRELLDRIAEWKRMPITEDRALAIVQYVQDDIQLQPVQQSITPTDPSTVYGKRSGDSKDKSLLLVTILRAAGFDAAPVLVNSQTRQTLDNWQPTPHAFDRAIVQLNLNGDTIWIDPTRTFQRGPFSKHFLPSYARGLVLRPRTTALTVIPESTVNSSRTVTEQFQLQWVNHPSDLKVTTIVTGRDAEQLRAKLATTEHSQFEKDMLDTYTARYGETTQTAPIAVSDDESQNQIQLTANYSIANVWQRPSTDQQYHCEFYPPYIKDLLQLPSVTTRSMPLAIQYPAHEIHKVEATFPENWFVPVADKTIADPAFTFRRTVNATPRQLILQYEYTALTGVVTVPNVPQYLQHAQAASGLLPFQLFPR
jgi:transglutaminase-like putative cysteine protease